MSELLSGSGWGIASIALPLAGAMLATLLPRGAAAIGLGTSGLTAAATFGLLARVLAEGEFAMAIGGWAAPLGIRLVVDGLSALMLVMTAVVGAGVSLHARAYFAASPEVGRFFWPLWLFLWSALDALYQSGDAFNLYVTIELVGLSAVSLVALTGSAPALIGAMRESM